MYPDQIGYVAFDVIPFTARNRIGWDQNVTFLGKDISSKPGESKDIKQVGKMNNGTQRGFLNEYF